MSNTSLLHYHQLMGQCHCLLHLLPLLGLDLALEETCGSYPVWQGSKARKESSRVQTLDFRKADMGTFGEAGNFYIKVMQAA
ncbi:hypothetical protein Y1Q_0009748 [Alligator mississippiensis]|uniref:Uncharacterized protein n=1 Tax=Alligator mississippiensis TaxID=8496 RepID=A0A151MWP7_ALLMI|nr:hypothetical protein Y1Q_0009748 [Alligator mississippiensis]